MNEQSSLRQFALSTSDAGLRAIQTIAAHAQARLGETGPAGKHDRLLGWSSITEFGDFKLTIRCDYKPTK